MSEVPARRDSFILANKRLIEDPRRGRECFDLIIPYCFDNLFSISLAFGMKYIGMPPVCMNVKSMFEKISIIDIWKWSIHNKNEYNQKEKEMFVEHFELCIGYLHHFDDDLDRKLINKDDRYHGFVRNPKSLSIEDLKVAIMNDPRSKSKYYVEAKKFFDPDRENFPKYGIWWKNFYHHMAKKSDNLKIEEWRRFSERCKEFEKDHLWGYGRVHGVRKVLYTLESRYFSMESRKKVREIFNENDDEYGIALVDVEKGKISFIKVYDGATTDEKGRMKNHNGNRRTTTQERYFGCADEKEYYRMYIRGTVLELFMVENYFLRKFDVVQCPKYTNAMLGWHDGPDTGSTTSSIANIVFDQIGECQSKEDLIVKYVDRMMDLGFKLSEGLVILKKLVDGEVVRFESGKSIKFNKWIMELLEKILEKDLISNSTGIFSIASTRDLFLNKDNGILFEHISNLIVSNILVGRKMEKEVRIVLYLLDHIIQKNDEDTKKFSRVRNIDRKLLEYLNPPTGARTDRKNLLDFCLWIESIFASRVRISKTRVNVQDSARDVLGKSFPFNANFEVFRIFVPSNNCLVTRFVNNAVFWKWKLNQKDNDVQVVIEYFDEKQDYIDHINVDCSRGLRGLENVSFQVFVFKRLSEIVTSYKNVKLKNL